MFKWVKLPVLTPETALRTGVQVDQIDSTGIVAGGVHVLSDTVLWAAGVVASPAAKWLNVEAGRGGRVKVNADLSVPGLPNVFVIGDTADVVAEWRNLLGLKTGRAAMPGLAQSAIQEGATSGSIGIWKA